MKIDITHKTLQELQEVRELYPDGYIKSIGDKTFWVFGSSRLELI